MTATAATEKKTRGDGPVKVSYANAAAKDHKRVPTDVSHVVIADPQGKAAEYDVSALPEKVKAALVAFAVAQRLKTYANNNLDEEKNGVDVLDLTNKHFAELMAGNLYSASADGTGKKAGKPFDVRIWIDAVKMGAEARRKKDANAKMPTEANLQALEQKLLSLAGRERTAFIQQHFMASPFIKSAYMTLKAKKTVSEASSEDALDSLF